jgi:hypothetical protein
MCCFQLLICADDVNLLGRNVTTVRKYTETLFDASKEVSIDMYKNAYAEKTSILSCVEVTINGFWIG